MPDNKSTTEYLDELVLQARASVQKLDIAMRAFAVKRSDRRSILRLVMKGTN